MLAEQYRTRLPAGRVLFTSGHRGALRQPDGPMLEKPYRVDALARRVRAVLDGEGT